MNKKQLIENATAKRATINYDYINQIGICFRNQFVYHWFKILDDNQVLMTHSYSTNTGVTKRGLKHKIRIQDKLGFYNHIK